MWREKGAELAREGDGEKVGDIPRGRKYEEISYKVDWAAQWHKNGDPTERNMRVMIPDNEEWQIWRYNNPKANKDEARSSGHGSKGSKKRIIIRASRRRWICAGIFGTSYFADNIGREITKQTSTSGLSRIGIAIKISSRSTPTQSQT